MTLTVSVYHQDDTGSRFYRVYCERGMSQADVNRCISTMSDREQPARLKIVVSDDDQP